MESKSFVLKGNVCYNTMPQEVRCVEGGYAVCVDGVSAGVFDELPEKYAGLPLVDCGDNLVIPGMSDIHIHAPQYAFRGLGMDLELLDWLNTHTFPEEAHYADLAYAERAYDIFANDLRHSPTTRAVVFGTMHLEEDTAQSAADTRRWLADVEGRYDHTAPIITPRFTPSVTDELMAELADIAHEKSLPVQSHLSENPSECGWVKELCPWSSCYGEAYDHFGLLGPRTVMAHCIYSDETETELLSSSGTYVAHCPQSNAQLSSGIAPIRRYLDLGMNVGLGTDVAGGANLSMFRCMADAVAVSKLRWRLVDDSLPALTTQEALWLATAGGGSFFGRVGSLAEGYEFDALVLDDSNIATPRDLSVWERLERYVYLAEEGGSLVRKYVSGREIDLS